MICVKRQLDAPPIFVLTIHFHLWQQVCCERSSDRKFLSLPCTCFRRNWSKTFPVQEPRSSPGTTHSSAHNAFTLLGRRDLYIKAISKLKNDLDEHMMSMRGEGSKLSSEKCKLSWLMLFLVTDCVTRMMQCLQKNNIVRQTLVQLPTCPR